MSVNLNRWWPEETHFYTTGKPFKNVSVWRRKDEALLSVFLITAASLRKGSDAEMYKSGLGSQLNSEQMWEALETVQISSSPLPPLLPHLDWRLLTWLSTGSFVDSQVKDFLACCFMFFDVFLFRSQFCDVPSLNDSHRERRCSGVRTPDQPHGEQHLGGQPDWTAGQNHPYWSSECHTVPANIRIFTARQHFTFPIWHSLELVLICVLITCRIMSSFKMEMVVFFVFFVFLHSCLA